MPRWKKQGFSNKSNQYKTNSQLLATQWTGRRTTDDHNYCENSPVIQHIDTDDAEDIHVHNHDRWPDVCARTDRQRRFRLFQ